MFVAAFFRTTNIHTLHLPVHLRVSREHRPRKRRLQTSKTQTTDLEKTDENADLETTDLEDVCVLDLEASFFFRKSMGKRRFKGVYMVP